MVRFAGFDCTLYLRDTSESPYDALPEYKDPNDAGDPDGPVPTAIVYVPAEEGMAFAVGVRVYECGCDLGPFDCLRMKLSFDGETLKKRWHVGICDDRMIRKYKHYDTDGQYVKRKFVFSKLDVLEGTRDPENGDINSLGEITVSLYRWRITETKQRSPRKTDVQALPGIKSVSEKHLKGRDIAHSIG
jgi:hypothetical protein